MTILQLMVTKASDSIVMIKTQKTNSLKSGMTLGIRVTSSLVLTRTEGATVNKEKEDHGRLLRTIAA